MQDDQVSSQSQLSTTEASTSANDAGTSVDAVEADIKQDADDIKAAIADPAVKAVKNDAVKTFADVKAALWAISATARKDIHDLLSKIENEEGVGMGVVRKHLGI